MKRHLLVPLAATACLVAAAPPAAAAPLVRVIETYDPAVVERDADLSRACGFEVTASSKGHVRLTIHLDRNGDFVRAVANPSFRTTLTSRYASITTADRGMDRYTVNPDGTITVFGTGIHLKIAGGAHAIGLWVLVYDPETEDLVSAEYHGRFDVQAPATIEATCAALGPS